MRVVVTGAGGNAGTSVVKALAADRTVTDVLGVARRRPGLHIPGVRWTEADIDPGRSDLTEVFAGADAVVHPPRPRPVQSGGRTRPSWPACCTLVRCRSRSAPPVPHSPRPGTYASYQPIPACWTPLQLPLLDAGRAHDDLGWTRRPPPRRPAV